MEFGALRVRHPSDSGVLAALLASGSVTKYIRRGYKVLNESSAFWTVAAAPAFVVQQPERVINIRSRNDEIKLSIYILLVEFWGEIDVMGY